jgi:hypothetical protein
MLFPVRELTACVPSLMRARSNGVKQRTHAVCERDGGIYVTLSKPPPGCESDQYASMPSCGDRVLASRSAQLGMSVGGDGKKPSGACAVVAGV